MKKKIAVTGGIGCGKSLAIRYIAENGYPIFSCDDIYKDVIKSSEYIAKIQKYFPTCIVDHQIDRARLADLVFHEAESRKILNDIAHPLIMKKLYDQMEECEGTLVFAEVPLLFEGGYEKDFDDIIVITRSLEERILALQARDRNTREQIQARINSQIDYSSKEVIEKIKKSGVHILQNDGDKNDLKNQIQNLLQMFKNEAT